MKNLTIGIIIKLVLWLGLGGILGVGGLVIFIWGNQLGMTAVETYIKGSICLVGGLAYMCTGYLFHRQTLKPDDVLAHLSTDCDHNVDADKIVNVDIAKLLEV